MPIEQWVIEQVFDLGRLWQQTRAEPLNLAINISAIHWEHDRLCEDLKERLERHQLDASMFTLEITEQLALRSLEKNLQTMTALKAMGFKLAIDDFGTGFSSLNYLHRLPVDKLKIDQSFVRQLEDGGKNAAIVRSVVELAHQLDMQVVAEGVENELQRAALADWGCDYMQGYLFDKPLPVAEFLRLPARRSG